MQTFRPIMTLDSNLLSVQIFWVAPLQFFPIVADTWALCLLGTSTPSGFHLFFQLLRALPFAPQKSSKNFFFFRSLRFLLLFRSRATVFENYQKCHISCQRLECSFEIGVRIFAPKMFKLNTYTFYNKSIRSSFVRNFVKKETFWVIFKHLCDLIVHCTM